MQANAPPGMAVDFLSDCTPDPTTTPWEFVGTDQAVRGLKAEYFASPDLSGTPVVTRIDNPVDLDWEQDLIPVSENQAGFSARWTGRVVARIAGEQVFKVRADGGVRLIVDGKTLFDNFNSPPAPGFHPTQAFFAKIPALAGQPLNVELQYHRTGGFFGRAFRPPAGGFGGLLGVQLSCAALHPPLDIARYSAVIVCAGTDEEYEGEGLDRPFTLPEFQDDLIRNISRVNGRTIVVLHGGGSFDVQQWIDQVPALMHVFFPGQGGGQALGEILFGKVNPSGKLPISWEKRIGDNPAFANFPMPLNSEPKPINYSEGVFIGYRGYEQKDIKTQFPFGFGLSYTTFAYSGLSIKPTKKGDDNIVEVTFTVSNQGKRDGAEVAQLYVGEKNPKIARPFKELKGFQKIFLQAGKSKTITLGLDQRSFAYFDTSKQTWIADPGLYDIHIGASSQDIRLTGNFQLRSELTAGP